jgi:hypothetical protein
MFSSTNGTPALVGRSMHTTLRRLIVATPIATVFGIGAANVASMKLTPATVSAGGSSAGTVTVSGLCKSCVALVSLTSSIPSVATVPASVTTSNGISGASASFTARAVSGAAGCSLITAKAGTSSQSVLLTVQPSAASGLSLTLKTATAVGGSTDSGFVSLPPMNATLSTNPVAQLSSSDPNNAAVPSSVTLKPNFIEGGIIIYKAAFPISTRDSGRNTCAGITATSGASRAQTLIQIVTISG